MISRNSGSSGTEEKRIMRKFSLVWQRHLLYSTQLMTCSGQGRWNCLEKRICVMTIMTKFERADVFYEWVNSVICDWVTSVDLEAAGLDMLDVDAKVFMENFDIPRIADAEAAEEAMKSFVNTAKNPVAEYSDGFRHITDIMDDNFGGDIYDKVYWMYRGCFRYLYGKRRGIYTNFWFLYCDNKPKGIGVIIDRDTCAGLMEWARYHIRKYIIDGEAEPSNLDIMLSSIGLADIIVEKRFGTLKRVSNSYYGFLRCSSDITAYIYSKAKTFAGDGESDEDRLLWMHKFLFREVILRHYGEMCRLMADMYHRETLREMGRS